ncbi:MAG: alkylated DNA repair protein (DNA oxidative demethylase) AlkB [Saliniramus fredricksonii]|uniref:Alkylated DNA repair protein (DNA oxidative demethylase) n=1 Tax=Saliniramus fredricksonii TaxID=1653334 RepID=A0A0P7Y412_9HYPH|nr:alpha-ketoglutarate-dependent dioxygenase AlkB [Saliniramus fredricksonii]KPQ11275.1 MAG: alkylated DNA repair protein (DNA oxidative demethylase) AlkB [Saliniramus fredricksonii]SCC81806.1 alkylated DNA repair protein (DNA oxidative demethylase) [Saliniramus fredricksonii]
MPDTTTAITLAPGLVYHPGYLSRPEQEALLDSLRQVLHDAPLYTPRMPRSGKPFSVRMTNCGALGWVADQAGYRYQPHHPETGQPWPAMPPRVLRAWEDLAGYPHPPEACLVNYYAEAAKMGLHQDRDEADFDAPVVSLSLGDTAVFRYGGTQRGDPTKSVKLASGDAIVFGGESRLIFHGIDRLQRGSSTLLPDGGRINLTLRRVSAPGG